MKKCIAVLLAVVMLFTLAIPAFAFSCKPYRDYETYMCIGDSIAAGTCLTRSGDKCEFTDSWEIAEDGYIYRGFNHEVVPQAYYSIIQQELSRALDHDVGLIQAARSGFRAVEMRYLLGEPGNGENLVRVYNDFDETYLWGNSFFNVVDEKYVVEGSGKDTVIKKPEDGVLADPEFTVDYDIADLDRQLKVGLTGRSYDYFGPFEATDGSRLSDPSYVDVDSYVDAVKKADLISLNLGSNDVFSFTFASILGQMGAEYSIPCLSAAADYFRETGDLGAAFAQLVDACETLGMVSTLISNLLKTFDMAIDQFEENYDAIVKRIYEINPKADIVSISCYNPMSQFRLSADSDFNLDAIIAPYLLRMNGIMERYTFGEHADHYFYADVSGTETYPMSLNDDNFLTLFIFKVHPTIVGHEFMAKQTLKAINNYNINIFGDGNVHYVRLLEQLLKSTLNNITGLFAKLLSSGFTFGPVSFG